MNRKKNDENYTQPRRSQADISQEPTRFIRPWGQDTGRQDAYRQDTGRQDAYRQDTGRQGARRQNAGRQNADRQNARRQNADRPKPGTQDWNRKKSRREKSKPRRIIGSILKWFFIMLFLIILVGGITVGITIRSFIADAPELTAMTVSPSQSASYICDSKGSRVQKLTLPEANRDLVLINQIPRDLEHAFVAIEDSRFYSHNGIDIPGIIRAFFKGIRSGSFSEGASTITQQLIKNTVFTNWTEETTFKQRLKRKVQEQYLAVKLEKILDKPLIMEDYLNTINLGAGCYGVQAAAFRYFGKDVSELTLSEDAVIASITQNPTRYNPITHPEDNKARRLIVLEHMLDQGYIDEAQYKEALADDVYARIQSNEDNRDVSTSIYTYYQDALIDQVITDLTDTVYNGSRQEAYKAVYTGGLRIYSAQDDALQLICDEEFKNPANFPADAGYGIDYALSIQSPDGEVTHYGNEDLRSWIRETSDPSFDMMFSSEQAARDAASAFRAAHESEDDTFLGERVTVTPQPQASVVIMDQSTGYVKAIVGGRGNKDASLTLNRATYTTRQPGSTFKVLTAFAPALDQCGKTLATAYENGDFYYTDGTKVSNWDVSDYGGNATIHESIVRSINVVAVECLTEITPQLGYDYAKSFGISTLTDHYVSGNQVLSDVVQPLALGGITKGVTNLELCGAYASIANEGTYMRPLFYTRVENYKGEVILDARNPEGRSVIKHSTASLLTHAMVDVIKDKKGTAYEHINLGAMPAAGKTGTTSDYRDIWFAGYTPYYTCCVWGGYDNNDCLPDSDIGHNYSKVLWNSIMKRIHEDLPVRQFPFSGDVLHVAICSQTGQAADANCPNTYEEWYAVGTQPTIYCSVHGSGMPVGSSAQDIVIVPGDSSGNSQADGNAGTASDDSPFPVTTTDSWSSDSQDPTGTQPTPTPPPTDPVPVEISLSDEADNPPGDQWQQEQDQPWQPEPGQDGQNDQSADQQVPDNGQDEPAIVILN